MGATARVSRTKTVCDHRKTLNNIGVVGAGPMDRGSGCSGVREGVSPERVIIMVFVLSKTGKPLMPTDIRHARRLLNKKRAEIAGHDPFTIRLLDREDGVTQPVEICEDTGSDHIGFSLKSEKHEFASVQADNLSDEKEMHENQSWNRRARRNRKRYRAPRFNNRTHGHNSDEKRFAPSIRHKIENHISWIERYANVCPVQDVWMEVGSFDTQLLAALEEGKPVPEGTDYQHGERYGMDTRRAAVFFRDGYTCQCCGKKNKIFEVHHIVFRSMGGSDRLENLITLCTDCHTPENHQKGHILYDWAHGIGLPKRHSYKGAAFMNTARWEMIRRVKELLPDVTVHMTYGTQTKRARHKFGIEKSHVNDAYVMGSFHPKHRTESLHYKKRRRNDRKLEKFQDATYIDRRNGEDKKASELGCNRKKRRESRRSDRNIRPMRGKKMSRGMRKIRRQRYEIRPGDTARCEGKIYPVVGTQGDTIALRSSKWVPIADIVPATKRGKELPLAVGQNVRVCGQKTKHKVLDIGKEAARLSWILGRTPQKIEIVTRTFGGWERVHDKV